MPAVALRRSAEIPARDPKSLVHSLAKGLRVLEAFTAQAPERTLAELARAAGLDNATAFRILNTLEAAGYVARAGDPRRFRLTLKTLDLGFTAIARQELRDAAQPVLRSLVGAVNEAASMGVLEGAEVVYVARVQAGLARLGVDIRVGSRVPAYCSAIGHALLAFTDRAEQAELLKRLPRVKLTPATPTALSEIQARLAEVRTRGYALSDQEVVAGLRVMAAPVLDAKDRPLAAISVAAPSLRAPRAEFVKLTAGPLTAAARELSRLVQTAGVTA